MKEFCRQVAYNEVRPKSNAGVTVPSPPGSDTDFVDQIEDDSGDDDYASRSVRDDLDLGHAVAGPSTATNPKPASAPRPKVTAPAVANGRQVAAPVVTNGRPVATIPSFYTSPYEKAVRTKNIEILIGWAQELKSPDVENLLRSALIADRNQQSTSPVHRCHP